ncbi:ABC transporter ATP-binding protein YtrB [bacterium HR10]|nr:ABC transporter ATP-binding protein YtrB [bacterium HR10]
MSDTIVLEVEELEKHYRNFSLRVSFCLASGEVLGVVGPNGAGKTTLIHGMLGIVKRDRGRVRFFGLDVDQHEVAIKQRVGFFLEEAPLFRQMRAGDVLKFFASFYPRWDWSLANTMIQQFELDMTKKVSELSKGMRAKLGLITAFSHRPELVILDEPTAGLDPGMRREFVQVVRELRRDFNPTILLTSHIMADIEDLADRIAFLREGKVALIESKTRLLHSWRRLRGRCRDVRRLDPGDWVAIEHDQASGEVHVVTNRWSPALMDRVREAGFVDPEAFALNLEEIYSYVIGARGREAAVSPVICTESASERVENHQWANQ